MINLQTTVNIKTAKALFGDQLPKALPFVKMGMLTRLANGGREAVVKRMPLDFDGPTSFTLRGVRVESAKPQKLQASVLVPDSEDYAGKNIREYLRPVIYGIPKRRQKRTEFLLSRNGFLPFGWVTTPGKGAKLNSSGNIPAPVYKQIVNVLQIKLIENKTARGISEKSQRRAKKMGVEKEWFAVKPGKNNLGRKGSWLPPGVYRRVGRNGEQLKQILKFVQRAAYRPRLDFKGTVEDYVLQNVQSAWDASTRSVFAKFSTPK